MRSSTTRKRPACSLTAATVTSGFHAMHDSIAAGGAAVSPRSATPGGAKSVLRSARVPHRIELCQIKLGDRRIVEVGYAIPGVRAHAIYNRPIVRDQVGRGALRGF